MRDVLNPAWQQEMVAEIEQAEAEEESTKRLTVAAQLVLESSGPEFWHKFVKEAAINTEALVKNKKLGVRGRTSPKGSPGGEQLCRIEIARTGIFPSLTWMDLFYMPGDSRIRCYTLEGNAFELTFVVRGNGKGVAIQTEDEFYPVAAETLAEMLTKQMVKQVRSAAY